MSYLIPTAMSSIQEVYAYNLEESFRLLAELANEYPILGIDTEFPGYFEEIDQLTARTSERPVSHLQTRYGRFKINIDNLRLIELGISLANDRGAQPSPSTFEFNFVFDKNHDVGQEASIQLLERHDVPFEKLLRDGISPRKFSYQILISGLLFNPRLKWIYFHGYCDLGYLVKAITLEKLPLSLGEFNLLAGQFFPHYYDLKLCEKWESSLEALASYCGVEREGVMHQAGSDAMVTVGIWTKCAASRNLQEYDRKVYGLDDE